MRRLDLIAAGRRQGQVDQRALDLAQDPVVETVGGERVLVGCGQPEVQHPVGRRYVRGQRHATAQVEGGPGHQAVKGAGGRRRVAK